MKPGSGRGLAFDHSYLDENSVSTLALTPAALNTVSPPLVLDAWISVRRRKNLQTMLQRLRPNQLQKAPPAPTLAQLATAIPLQPWIWVLDGLIAQLLGS